MARIELPKRSAALAILKDPRFGAPVIVEPESAEVMWTTFGRWLINLDGDRHHQMRQRFSRVFTSRKVEQYRPFIHARANAFIDAVYGAATES